MISWILASLAACGVSFGVLLSYAASAAEYYRPIPFTENTTGLATKLREVDENCLPFALLLARFFVCSIVTTVMKLIMTVRNSVEIIADENSDFLLESMRHRSSGAALITVGNHASSLDDPGLLAAIMPWDVIFNPYSVRWALATQDICFPDGKPAVQAFMGAGKTLPVLRGGGIDQPLWRDAARVVGAGQWVHVFPEARVVQTGRLNLDPITARGPEELARKGRLKWGVAKLIAHAPVPPVVIPIHHVGMVGVLPQNNVWKVGPEGRKVYDNLVVKGGWNIWKIRGHKVRVRAGAALRFDDLIREHEARHGPLHKVTGRPESGDWDSEMERWKSTDAERELYSAITRRVERALLELEGQAQADLKLRPDPAIQAHCPRARAACADPAAAALPPRPWPDDA